MLDVDETIVAESSALGCGQRSIVRISGRETLDCIAQSFDLSQQLAGIERPNVIRVKLPINAISRRFPARILIWPNPRSYTRQPMAEIHLLGSPPIVRLIIDQLCTAGARLANPGEFTLRAYLAGRLELAQAEALLGIVNAKSAEDVDLALEQLAGGVAGQLLRTQDQLMNLLADVEAGLDFVEDDIEFVTDKKILHELDTSLETITKTIHQLSERQVSANDFRVVLFGQPNVGKSSLFNALLGRNLSNTDATHGTTRDFVGANWKVDDGLEIELIDTAGIHSLEETDLIDQRSQEHSGSQIKNADLLLLVLDGSRALSGWEQKQLQYDLRNLVVVVNKSDRPQKTQIEEATLVSCVDKTGLEQLRKRITEFAEATPVGHSTSLVASECASSLANAEKSTQMAIEALNNEVGHEVVAGMIRDIIDNLGVVTGSVHTEEILDRVFSRFCIGK